MTVAVGIPLLERFSLKPRDKKSKMVLAAISEGSVQWEGYAQLGPDEFWKFYIEDEDLVLSRVASFPDYIPQRRPVYREREEDY